MKWQYLAIQTVLTLVALIIAVRFFGPNEQLSHRIDELESKLNNIASNQDEAKFDTGNLRYLEIIKNIDSRLTRIEKERSLSKAAERSPWNTLNKKSAGPDDRLDQLRNTPPPDSQLEKSREWLSELSDEQRRQVETILKEHFLKLAEVKQAGTPDSVANPEEAREAFERRLQELKDQMREVLDEDQYQKFEASLPTTKTPDISNLPQLPGQ